MRGLILKFFLLAVTLLLNLSAFYNAAPLLRISSGLFLLIVLISKRWSLLHFALLIFLIGIKGFYFPPVLKDIPALRLLLPFVFSTLAVLPFSRTRAALCWFKRGGINRSALYLIVLTGALSVPALLIWARWTNNLGAGPRMAEEFLRYPGWIVLCLGVPLFALVNAFAEEAVFRGAMQEALSQVFSREPLILFLQASAFASIHFVSGFPNGYAGYLMALAYGLALGYLRMITHGILAPYLAHVLADLTIGYYLYSYVS